MEVQIQAGLHLSKILTESAIPRIRESLRVPHYKYSNFRKENVKVGEIDFVTEDGYFRTGLLDLIQTRLASWYYDCNVDQEVRFPDLHLRDIGGLVNFEHRSYVQPAIDALVQHRRGIWSCATNAGKTYMGAAATYHLGLRTIFLVPPQRSDLVFQAYADFRTVGFTDSQVSWIKGSSLTDTEIVIASTATIASRLDRPGTKEWLSQFQFGIYDECHELPPTAVKVLDALDAPYRLFMSGTPILGQKAKDLLMIGMSGRILYRITNKLLIDAGHSAEPHVLYLTVPHTRRFFHEGYKKVYDQEIVRNQERNSLIVTLTRLLVKAGEAVVILVDRKSHAREIVARLNGMGIKSDIYTGDVKTGGRSSRRAMFSAGDLQVLVANRVFDVGLSLPEITALIIAGGGKASHTNLQRAGRGLRKKTDRNVLFIVDIQDDCIFLKGQGVKRRRVWETQSGFTVHETQSVGELVQIVSRLSADRSFNDQQSTFGTVPTASTTELSGTGSYDDR